MALPITIDNSKLAILRARNYLGIAKIKLGALNFDHPLIRKKHRLLSKKNVRRLRNVFKRVGYKRLEKEKFINAEGNLIPFVNLRSVDCLRGLYRIKAAKEFLDDNDQWWIVRLFSKDGKVFRKIRYYYLKNDTKLENRWWALLDGLKPNDLRQLFKNSYFARAFNALIGALYRFLTLKCDEGLRPISINWKKIISCNVVDVETNISLVDCLIPLLRTFFENLKYLKPCCIILKHLIGNKIKGTIYKSLKGCYYCPKNLTIPFLEMSYRKILKENLLFSYCKKLTLN
ncbi:hypothetical protein V2W45_1465362 [Cenococcum geophilum]